MRADWGLISLNVIPACSAAQLLIVTLCVMCDGLIATQPWYFAWSWWQVTSADQFISGGITEAVTECDVMTAGCSLLSPGPDYVTSWAPAPGGDTGPASLRHEVRGCQLVRSPGCHSHTWAPPGLGADLRWERRGEAAVNTPLVTRQSASQSVTHCPLCSPPLQAPLGPATVCWSQVATPLLCSQ